MYQHDPHFQLRDTQTLRDPLTPEQARLKEEEFLRLRNMNATGQAIDVSNTQQTTWIDRTTRSNIPGTFF